MSMKARIARGIKLGLSQAQAAQLSALRTPHEVQNFVNAIPMNFEIGGGTALSVVETLRQNRAHCIEAAMVAACAFYLNGRPPLLMDMGAADGDDDHVIALFRHGSYWGAVSKTNGPYVRFRDPIYMSLRELALSYFHEYTKGKRKTLRTYSVAVDLRRADPKLWVTNPKFCEEIVDMLTIARHFKLVPRGHEAVLRPLDRIDMRAHKLAEFVSPRAKKKAML